MKPGRQSLILEIILEKEIETQNQLLEELARRGVKSTQATLSRDLKDMRLIKVMGSSGRYCYAASGRDEEADKTEEGEAVSEPTNGRDEESGVSDRLRKILRQSVVSYDVAQNLFIIKTLPGLASAVCSAFDGMELEEIVGTLAGDDTGFIALRSTEAAMNLYHKIEELL